jgi:hypothetical protein
MKCNLCGKPINEGTALSVLQGEMVKCVKRSGTFFHPFLEDGQPMEHFFHVDCLSEFIDFADSEDRVESLYTQCNICHTGTVLIPELLEMTPINVKYDHNDRPVITLKESRYNTVIRTYICWDCIIGHVGEGDVEAAFNRLAMVPITEG